MNELQFLQLLHHSAANSDKLILHYHWKWKLLSSPSRHCVRSVMLFCSAVGYFTARGHAPSVAMYI